jgi:hypothetical protein
VPPRIGAGRYECEASASIRGTKKDNLPMLGAPGGFIAFGKNIRRLVGQVTTQSRAEQLGPELAAVVNRDPRINPGLTSVALTVQPAGARYNLTIAVNATTTTALPISLVYGITAATVERLAAGT